MPIASGTRFGPYEIICSAGAGGMGEVYRAKDTRLDRVVAVKVLPSDLAHDLEKRQRFEREARSISTLSHPHICTLHDVGHQNGVDYLVFEYLEGETLEKKLGKGSLPVQEVLRYAIELADALDKAHRQGIIHRDIKPGNIMLTKSGVKLMDFGLAKLKSDPMPVADTLTEMTSDKKLTAEGTILGTFQYMTKRFTSAFIQRIETGYVEKCFLKSRTKAPTLTWISESFFQAERLSTFARQVTPFATYAAISWNTSAHR
jgi:serine/threonine protein kinase